jgi:ATP-dependent Clp protease adaptor protein ClpS
MSEEMTTITEVEPTVEQEQKLAPLYRVLIHNDDKTPMDFVVRILVSEFEREMEQAVKIMWEAHTTGAALVMTCGEEEATRRVERAHSLARTQKYPLTFSIEPEDL